MQSSCTCILESTITVVVSAKEKEYGSPALHRLIVFADGTGLVNKGGRVLPRWEAEIGVAHDVHDWLRERPYLV